MKRKFTVTLGSLDKLVNNIEEYCFEMKEGEGLLRHAVADEIKRRIDEKASNAIADDLFSTEDGADSPKMAELNTSWTDTKNNKTKITVSGEDVAFVEFGAGVYYNGPVGTSPNPYQKYKRFSNYTIGSYGMGQGKNSSWTFTDSLGVHHTHGTPASMPIYRSMTEMRAILPEFCQVFWGKLDD